MLASCDSSCGKGKKLNCHWRKQHFYGAVLSNAQPLLLLLLHLHHKGKSVMYTDSLSWRSRFWSCTTGMGERAPQDQDPLRQFIWPGVFSAQQDPQYKAAIPHTLARSATEGHLMTLACWFGLRETLAPRNTSALRQDPDRGARVATLSS